ncbi:MAG: nicotinate-nucleotide adenylyltransferase [Devosia sp.]
MADYLKRPAAEPGMRIGLFGGSFNPAHDGHRLVVLECLKRLRLDVIWVLVSPGNPLKNRHELAPISGRIEQTKALLAHQNVVVTAFEAERGFTYSYQTVEYLKSALPGVNFVWIMGADSLQNFDHWERWEEIANMVPMAIYARPGSTFRATRSKAAVALSRYRIPEDAAETLAGRDPPAWVYLRGVMSPQSSSAIRKSRGSST